MITLFDNNFSASKPGECPRAEGELNPVGTCASLCSHDITCPGAQKCCATGCGYSCTEPRKCERLGL